MPLLFRKAGQLNLPRIGRTLPPAACPFSLRELIQGLRGARRPEEVTRFEEELKHYCKVRHCFAVSSGKTALLLVLRALKKMDPNRDEVLIPAYTCYSLPSAIVRAGLKVRPCDLDPRTLDFDFDQLAGILDQQGAAGRLLCIVPIHLYGLRADILRLKKLTAAKGLPIPIVEDAAQAMGEGGMDHGTPGTLGDIGFFSFGRGKPLSLGGGGAIVTNRDDFARLLAPLAAALPAPSPLAVCRLVALSFALLWLGRPCWFWLPKALPWLRLGETIYDPEFQAGRLSAFQAGMARNWERRLAAANRDRLARVEHCRRILPRQLLLPVLREKGQACLRLPVRINDPERRLVLLAGSDRLGLGLMPGYPDPISALAPVRDGKQPESFPEAESLAREIVTLPVHSLVTDRDLEKMAGLIGNTVPTSGPRRQRGMGERMNGPHLRLRARCRRKAHTLKPRPG